MLRFDHLPWHHQRGGGGGGGGIIAIVQQLFIATILLPSFTAFFLLPMTMTLIPSANAYSILDVLKLTGTTAATCPAECTLCSCLDISSTMSTSTSTPARSKLIDECTQAKSIEACQTQTLDKCFLQLLFPTASSSSTTTSSGAMKENVDIAGLCAIQCPTTGATRLGTAIQCRLCDVFTCCGTCPLSMADQCFPPPPTITTTGGGYTPTEWKPLVCKDTAGGSGGKRSSSAGGRRGGFGIGTMTVVGLLTLFSYGCFVIFTNIIV